MTLDEERVYELLRERLQEEAKRRGRGFLLEFDRAIGKDKQGWASKLLNGAAPMFTIGTLLAALRQLRLTPSRFFLELEENHGWEVPPDTAHEAVQAFLKSLDTSGELRNLVRQEIQKILKEEGRS